VKTSALFIVTLTPTFASPGISASPTTISAPDTGHPIALHIGGELEQYIPGENGYLPRSGALVTLL
jgi:hypothetical protein